MHRHVHPISKIMQLPRLAALISALHLDYCNNSEGDNANATAHHPLKNHWTVQDQL
jgi:hypothetical protein